MIRNRYVLRIVAVFLTLLTINSLFLPTLSYALTAGPTAPEYTSFEPVDTTDMVNLATGDFTYNIPLLEVPGPEGGYPLSLSYHAGIQPGVEASWVGLGWTLNPGAINRTVNGYPDDHSGVNRTVTDNWEGGSRSTFSVGVGLPGASFGLQFAQDTYKGFGVGSNMGVGVNFGEGAFGAGFNSGVGPYGGSYAGAGLSAGVPIGESSNSAAHLGGSIGISTNFESVSTYAGAGINVSGVNALGASISSSGLKPRFSVAGNTINQVNSNAGRVTVNESGFSVPIPVGTTGIWVTLGHKYMRYYSNEESEVSTWGTLHPIWKEPGENSFDSYALLDPDAEGGIVENAQADKVLGGSMPAFDYYNVTGQGLSGSIQPYLFRNFNMYRQNVHKVDDDNDKIIEYKTNYAPFTNELAVAFRFNNDFANTAYFKQEPTVDRTSGSNPFKQTKNTVGEGGFDTRKNQLAGSKHVEYYTNAQLNDDRVSKNGLIQHLETYPTELYGSEPSSLSNQIGGFKITNEAGVTYHYTLPVYAYDEQLYSETIDNNRGKSYNRRSHPHPYAYTWLLTAITGPDYVNRSDGKSLSDQDWGYWVKFNYNKHLNDYKWRNPAIGMHKDIDRNYQNYSRGKKELYYLSEIETRSHVASFKKSKRFDSREVSNLGTGGFKPISNCNFSTCTEACQGGDQNTCEECVNQNTDRCQDKPDSYPRAPLRLDEVQLFKKGTYSTSNPTVNEVVRAINFQYDYSLMPQTDNSYDETNNNEKQGKLTLKLIQFLGKGGADAIPPMSFDYGINNPDYQQEYYDMWGYYKDLSNYQDSENENVKRLTTTASAQETDAWSLTRLVTSLGSEIVIDYESDTYDEVVLATQQLLRIKTFERIDKHTFKISCHESNDLTEILSTKSLNSTVIGGYRWANASNLECDSGFGDCEMGTASTRAGESVFSVNGSNSQVVAVHNDYIIVKDSELSEKLNASKVDIDRRVAACCKGNVLCNNNDDYPIRNCKVYFEGDFDFILGGYIYTGQQQVGYPGGGIRVSSITVSESKGAQRTRYNYTDGTTSYEPFGMIEPIITSSDILGEPTEFLRNFFKKKSTSEYSPLLANAREVPPPGVIYGKVTVIEEAQYGDQDPVPVGGASVYHFQTFEENMVQRDTRPCEGCTSTKQGRAITFRDYTTRVGALKKVEQYGTEGQLLSETVNHYLYDEADKARYKEALLDRYAGQGLISQVVNERRIVEIDGKDYDQVLLTAREEYPALIVGSTTTNHKTGITTRNRNLAFDFFSGQPTEVLSEDSYGSKYVTVTTPAYRLYDRMGLKTEDVENKHMLSQKAERVTYKINDNFSFQNFPQTDYIPQGLVSASVQTWSDQVPTYDRQEQNATGQQANVWRKHRSLQWIGEGVPLQQDGTASVDDFELFKDWHYTPPAEGQPEPPASDPQWEEQSRITRYDVYSHPLEVRDVNQDFAATQMDYDQKLVLATAANAQYHEFAYFGGEGARVKVSSNTNEGLILPAGVSLSDQYAHTGQRSTQVSPNQKGVMWKGTELDKSRAYRASVWVYVTDDDHLDQARLYATGGLTQSAEQTDVKAGAWHLITLDVPAGQETLEIGCENLSSGTVYFDDFRVHPLDASIVSYVYDQATDELTHILNTDNFYTRYEYDAMGKLVATYQEIQHPVERQISKRKYGYRLTNKE